MYTGKRILIPSANEVICEQAKFGLSIESPHEIILRNHYSHISAGTELACIAGLESWFNIPGIPGYTSIAEVVEKGTAVGDINLGDIVYTYGPHASYFKIDCTDRWHGVCVKLPEGLNADLAAFTHMGGIAFTSIRKSGIEIGDHVLVTGLGVIGNLAAQLAQLQGAEVIATDINNSRIEIARQCGITRVINSAEEDLKSYIEKESSGEMISSYIDATGISSVINQSASCIKYDGEIILLGSPRASYESDLTRFLKHFHYLPWCGNLKAALEFTLPTFQHDFHKHSIERNASVLMSLIKNNKIHIKPFYSHKIHPEEAPGAYNGLKNTPDTYVGVVIDWIN